MICTCGAGSELHIEGNGAGSSPVCRNSIPKHVGRYSFYQVMCQETETADGWFEKAVEERDPTLIPSCVIHDETIAGQLPMAGAGQNDEPPANFRIVGALRNWAGSEFV